MKSLTPLLIITLFLAGYIGVIAVVGAQDTPDEITIEVVEEQPAIEATSELSGIEALTDSSIATIAEVVHFILFRPFFDVHGHEIYLAKLLIAFLLLLLGLFFINKATTAFEDQLRKQLSISRDAVRFLARMLRVFLLFEKPIRVGDLIEFEGVRGRVAQIGPRCTILQLPGNVDYLVPNRKLLENTLTNWTLSDDQVRSEINVGIAYGSDTRLMEKILLQAAQENKRVDEKPAPVVLFENFGDNSLDFQLLFWVRVTNFLEQRRIKSDLRFRIDELCRQNNIVIAFPQRDVHLDSQSPLEIKLIKDNIPKN